MPEVSGDDQAGDVVARSGPAGCELVMPVPGSTVLDPDGDAPNLRARSVGIGTCMVSMTVVVCPLRGGTSTMAGT